MDSKPNAIILFFDFMSTLTLKINKELRNSYYLFTHNIYEQVCPPRKFQLFTKSYSVFLTFLSTNENLIYSLHVFDSVN